MKTNIIILIVMVALLVIIITVGLLIKRYTKRRLGEIDGFQGVIAKKKYKGISLGVAQGCEDERAKADENNKE